MMIEDMKKGPTVKSDRFFNIKIREARAGIRTIYASLCYQLYHKKSTSPLYVSPKFEIFASEAIPASAGKLFRFASYL